MPKGAEQNHYFVEGYCEKRFIEAYKSGAFAFLRPGKISVINIVNADIPESVIRSLPKGCNLFLVYDIDHGNADLLEKNLRKIIHFTFGRVHLFHIQSVKCFEDEIVFSTSIKSIADVFHTKSKTEFKKSLLACKDIHYKMSSIDFDWRKMWSRTDRSSNFCKYANEGDLKKVKTKQ